jgi:hypothetical protein
LSLAIVVHAFFSGSYKSILSRILNTPDRFGQTWVL